MTENKTPQKTTAEVLITGITCAACVSTLENHIKSLKGVYSASVNLVSSQASCDIDLNDITVEQLCEEIRTLGFDATLLKLSHNTVKSQYSSLSPLGSDLSDVTTASKSDLTPVCSALVTFKLTSINKSSYFFRDPHIKEIYGVIDLLKKIHGVFTCNFINKKKNLFLLICYNPHVIGARFLYTNILNKLQNYTIKPEVFNHAEQSIKDEFDSVKLKLLWCIIPTIIVAVMAMTPHEKLPHFLRANIIKKMNVCSLVMFILTTPIHFICGWQFHKNAFIMLKKRYMTMDLLVSLSTNLAYFYSVASVIFSIVYATSSSPHQMHIIGHGAVATYENYYTFIPHYFETPAVLITVLLIGKYIEAKVKLKNCRTINRLHSSQKKECIILCHENDFFLRTHNSVVFDQDFSNLKQIEIPTALIQINDIVLAYPSTSVPADGYVEKIFNHLTINESVLTGESTSIAKSVGDKVYAGSIVETGTLCFKVTDIDNNTFLGQIKTLVELANSKKSYTQVVADKISQWFVPCILLISLITFFFWIWYLSRTELVTEIHKPKYILAFQFAISVIAVACPCALGLATSTAVALSTGVACKHGILIRNTDVIQQASQRITDIIFDKTGTLTTGNLTLSYIGTNNLRQNTANDNKVWEKSSVDKDPNIQLTTLNKLILELKYNEKIQFPMSSLEKFYYDESIIRGNLTDNKNKTPETHDIFLLWLTASLQQKVSTHLISRTFTDFYAKAVMPYIKSQGYDISLATVESYQISDNGISGVLNCHEWFYKPIYLSIAIGNLNYLKESFKENPYFSNEEFQKIFEMENDEHKGSTITYLAINHTIVTSYILRDALRKEAEVVLSTLKKNYNCELWLCTGDTKRNAYYIANSLNIPFSNVKYQAKPSEKTEFTAFLKNNNERSNGKRYLFENRETGFFQRLKYNLYRVFSNVIYRKKNNKIKDQKMFMYEDDEMKLRNEINYKNSRRVLMIGDGINDGPSLAEANVGVAIGTKAQITAEAADVILIDSNLLNLVYFLELANKTIFIIHQNYLWAVIFNLVAIPVAAGVLYPQVMLPPSIAGSLMAISSIVVVLNSLRLSAFKCSIQSPEMKLSESMLNLV